MEDDAIHLSRHFLRLQAHHVVMLPGPLPGPPDSDGNSLSYKLFAVGGWVEDVQEEHLAIMALAVTKGPSGISSVVPRRLASWRHPGSVTALQVTSFGSGEVCIFSGGSTGTLCRLQLSMPTSPGATPADIQLRAGGFEGADLQPVAHLHRGEMSGVAVQDDTRQVATCGLDGRLFVLPALGDLSAALPLVDKGATASYWAVAWTSPQTIATAGTSGGLEIWDTRSAARPLVARSPLAWGATGFAALDAQQGPCRRITCLAVHPGRPHVAATGSCDGTVAVWDLRFTAPPAQCSLNDRTVGNVRKVQFDVSDAAVGGACLLFCTQGGVLAVATTEHSQRHASPTVANGGGGTDSRWEAEVLWRESCATMLCFDAEQEQGRDLVATSDQEMLVYIAR